jgi:CheY-like chemotaxis protein/predicted regulator of Ras-like GTPase activity (Roadblock/LC7/MglB family)
MSILTQKILIVDDDPTLLEHLTQSLSPYYAFSIVTAENGAEAVEVLDREQVDLVVTDVQMPLMDGFALVSHISQHHPKLPVIVITAHASPPMEHRLNRMGIVSFEKKPIDADALANRIFDLLVGAQSGYLQGISIPSFLQILQADNKSCSLKVTGGDKTGFLHLMDGQIMDAEFDGARGEEAAMAIIAWDESLTIDIQEVVRLKEKTVDRDTTFLIMDAVRKQDEHGLPSGVRVSDLAEDFVLPTRTTFPPSFLAPETPSACVNPGILLSIPMSEGDTAFYRDTLKHLFDVKGYKTSAVLTHSGEPIAVHSVNTQIDVAFVARNVNEMFCGLQSRAALLGMGHLEESVFRTRGGIILMRCLCQEDKPHVHIMSVARSADAEGLMRIRLKRWAETVALGPS